MRAVVTDTETVEDDMIVSAIHALVEVVVEAVVNSNHRYHPLA